MNTLRLALTIFIYFIYTSAQMVGCSCLYWRYVL